MLLGWTSRQEIVGSHARAIAAGGLFRPFALVKGRAVGTWGLQAGEVKLMPFGRLSRRDSATLEADAADVVRFLASR